VKGASWGWLVSFPVGRVCKRNDVTQCSLCVRVDTHGTRAQATGPTSWQSQPQLSFGPSAVSTFRCISRLQSCHPHTVSGDNLPLRFPHISVVIPQPQFLRVWFWSNSDYTQIEHDGFLKNTWPYKRMHVRTCNADLQLPLDIFLDVYWRLTKCK
jgi:hypothetical protein